MADFRSDGKSFLLSYFINSNNNVKQKEVHFCGFHKGQISGKNIIVEDFTNIPELIERVETLELIISTEMAEDILNRAEKANIYLDDDTIEKIKSYATSASE